VLYEKDLERMRVLALKIRVANGQKEKPIAPSWFRPWRISPLCIAQGHNTITWARVSKKKSCTCPHALALLEKYKEDRRKLERQERVTGRPVHYVKVQHVVPEPDWSTSACRNDIATAELGFDEKVSKRGIANRKAAKEMCAQCPLSMFRACEEWIRAKEVKPGELGGVYAGMDKWNRQGSDLKMINGKIKRVKWSRA